MWSLVSKPVTSRYFLCDWAGNWLLIGKIRKLFFLQLPILVIKISNVPIWSDNGSWNQECSFRLNLLPLLLLPGRQCQYNTACFRLNPGTLWFAIRHDWISPSVKILSSEPHTRYWIHTGVDIFIYFGTICGFAVRKLDFFGILLPNSKFKDSIYLASNDWQVNFSPWRPIVCSSRRSPLTETDLRGATKEPNVDNTEVLFWFEWIWPSVESMYLLINTSCHWNKGTPKAM